MRAAGLVMVGAALASGCPAGAGASGPRAAPGAGLALTYYVDRAARGSVAGLVVVEQRRWVEIGDDAILEIDRIDDGADLASLVIEPLGGRLSVGRCARDSVVQAMRATPSAWIGRTVEIVVGDGRTVAGTITAIADRQIAVAGAGDRTTMVTFDAWRAVRVAGGDPVVRCRVDAGHGRQLVRVVYATTALGFAVEHAIRATLDDADRGTAAIASRFTVETPAWQVGADVVLYDGLPAGGRPPRELFRGPITLTGDPVVVPGPVRTAPARIEAVYRYLPPPGDGAESPRDASWRIGASFGDVVDWLELELGDDALSPGRITLELARPARPVELVTLDDDALVLPAAIEEVGGKTRLRIGASRDLKGGRNKVYVSSVGSSVGSTLVESVVLSVSNGGDKTREVVVEEELRPHRRRVTIVRPFPARPILRGNVLRIRLAVPPGATRAGYVLDYDL